MTGRARKMTLPVLLWNKEDGDLIEKEPKAHT